MPEAVQGGVGWREKPTSVKSLDRLSPAPALGHGLWSLANLSVLNSPLGPSVPFLHH